MTGPQLLTFDNPDGSGAQVTVGYAWTPPPPPPAPPSPTIVGLDDPTPDAMLAPYVGAQRLFAGNALPDCTKLPAHTLAMPSMPMRATGRPTTAAFRAMLASRPAGVFIPNHEANRPGKPAPDEIASNMAWCRQQIDAYGNPGWLLAVNFDSYPQMHGGNTFDMYADAIQYADLLTWDIYVDLNLGVLPSAAALMAPYLASRKAYPGKRGGVLELGVMARAPRALADRQAAADLYADCIDMVSADGGFVVCPWGTVGEQVDKFTGKTIDYTPVPGSPEHTVIRDRMRIQ